VRWFRSEGWQLPGLRNATAIEKVNLDARDGRHLIVNGRYQHWPDGVTVSSVKHRGKYLVTFPEASFEVEGVHKKMLSRTFGRCPDMG
jgi:hypothetical protein